MNISNNLLDVLSLMDNTISKKVSQVLKTKTDLNYDYIDLSGLNDTISFTPSRKVKEVLEKIKNTYRFNESYDIRRLVNSHTNRSIFNPLGYDYTKGEMWNIGRGDEMVILAETISNTSNRIYALVTPYDSEYNEKLGVDDLPNSRLAVVNKGYLTSQKSLNFLWNTSRNNIKIGRFVRSLLLNDKFKFVDKDIEDFTNRFKATFDFKRDSNRLFDIVRGNDIKHWYYRGNYGQGGGTLQNSCMGDVPDGFLDIYSENDVRLVILYSDGGSLSAEGKYTSNKIMGRALLWKAKVETENGYEDIEFLDRIYTQKDSDVELFKKYADENNWWYKRQQNMYPDADLLNANNIINNAKIQVYLDNVDLEKYPYIDTMCYLNVSEKRLSNFINNEVRADRCIRRTGGDYDYI